MKYMLSNDRGLSVEFLDIGGCIKAIASPDRNGQIANVVLGFATEEEYHRDHPYFGALVGRFSGRIARAQFELEGVRYQLSANNGRNHIAGGLRGFDKQLWRVEMLSESAARLSYSSPDGEEGFPGRLDVTVTYSVTADNVLRLDYEAVTDAATVLNLTNHSYFNLGGEGSGSVEGHILTVDASEVIEVDSELIPTGRLLNVVGSPLDFCQPFAIGARIRSGHPLTKFAKGYDCSFVLNGGPELRHVARAYDPLSGRILDVETTEPSMAFYSGNFLDGSLVGASGRQYRQGDAFTLEPRRLPDSPNQPTFPTTVLRPGEKYQATTIYRFSTDSGR
ncbi:aldose 1-epimerase [Rhizobium petrolearium]|uniref:aldose epimerase family protein n=1 Tax=Neorhizobium petrolearium TaxID=515361 RepID=UPI001AE6D3C2|nr:aldose epimerase family protein [Neorhizobium petrolearium]MBP1848133.1 aldose 1-epimerase [Neorhizobium petrolearium]